MHLEEHVGQGAVTEWVEFYFWEYVSDNLMPGEGVLFIDGLLKCG